MTPCDTMQCNMMSCDAVWCNMTPCDTMQCNMMSCDAVWCNMTPCDTMQCNMMSCDAVWCNMTSCAGIYTGQYDGTSEPLPEYHVKIAGFDEKVCGVYMCICMCMY